ncbi:hypothetical protein HU200_024073 [Digitaria exilis]|uniref:Myb/SANT-like domain-containing protein n=1 Tax=Digitaria exilis TaxID=1010633 RepID=A0A835C102_9POAL|nr:hypothetical protein HU200_024073 [Digitaria exilis]
MTNRGYENIAGPFYERTSLRHSVKQLRNRWDQLKSLYTFWTYCNKQSGLGKSGTGGIIASDAFWDQHCKKQPERKKLKYGPPECLEDLEVMFEGVTVDGSSSCIPGENAYDGAFGDRGVDYEEYAEKDYGSPMTTGSLKRTSSSNTTVTSPRKKVKSPLVKIMKGMWGTMQTTATVAQKAMSGEFETEGIKEAMRLAVECGAKPRTPEHFMASKLFTKNKHRTVFLTLESNEDRLFWLQQWCQEKNIH